MAGLRAANIFGLTSQETNKRWSVNASLGMFYDDNNLNAPVQPKPSLGVEVYPELSLNLPLERTLFKASYGLRLDYYQDRPTGNLDQEHQAHVLVDHKNSERSSIQIDESFFASSQPEITEGTQTTFQRSDRGDFSHWRNYLRLDYDVRLAPTYGVAMGYRSYVYDYKQRGIGSLSALLDRAENQVNFEGQLFPAEHVRLFVGYQLGFANYTSNDPLAITPVPITNGVTLGQVVMPSARNTISHYGYLGADRHFSPRLTGSLSMGAQLTEYYNQNVVEWSPNLDLSTTFRYLPGCFARLGAQVARNATDSGVGAIGLTRDQLSAIMTLNVRHRITPQIYATLSMRFQHSVYNGGDYDGLADEYLDLGPGVEYMIRQNLFVTLNYNHTELFSDVPNRAFGKNRILLGVRATY